MKSFRGSGWPRLDSNSTLMQATSAKLCETKLIAGFGRRASVRDVLVVGQQAVCIVQQQCLCMSGLR